MTDEEGREERRGLGLKCVLDDLWVPIYGGGKLCSDHILQLAFVCYGKMRRNLHSARWQVKKREREGAKVRLYVCPVCSTHHVGSYDPARVDGCVRAEGVVRQLRAAGFGWYVGTLAEDWHPQYAVRDTAKTWRSRITR